jgi:hypothetical protein
MAAVAARSREVFAPRRLTKNKSATHWQAVRDIGEMISKKTVSYFRVEDP